MFAKTKSYFLNLETEKQTAWGWYIFIATMKDKSDYNGIVR